MRCKMKDILRVGKIVNTHGLKGEVKVIPLTDDPKRYNDLEFVLIDGVERKMQGVKYQKDRVIVKVAGINSIEEAERLTFRGLQFNAVVSINKSALIIYEQIGFQKIGIIPGGFLLPDGSYSDMYILFMSLTGGKN